MTGDGLVVHRRRHLPRREPLASEGRVPRATGDGQVLRRGRVVGGRGDPCGRQHRLAAHQRVVDVEVRAAQILRRAIRELLQPCEPLLGAGDRGDQVEMLLRLHEAGAGLDLLDDAAHLGLEPRDLGPCPVVRLARVELAAEHDPCRAHVAILTDPVGRTCQRGDLPLQPVGELAERLARGDGAIVQLGSRRGEAREPSAAARDRPPRPRTARPVARSWRTRAGCRPPAPRDSGANRRRGRPGTFRPARPDGRPSRVGAFGMLSNAPLIAATGPLIGPSTPSQHRRRRTARGAPGRARGAGRR
jgi:hypothetical protein